MQFSKITTSFHSDHATDKQPKILIVEDDRHLLDVCQTRLKLEGYKVFRAHDGKEGIHQTIHHKPDLILCDIMMPKLNGFDMIEVIRRHGSTKDSKIVIMSALGEQIDKVRGYKLGVVNYLVKSQSTLENIVNSIKIALQPSVNPAS